MALSASVGGSNNLKKGGPAVFRRLTLPLIVALMVVTATPALATWDGTDPHTSGCDNGAVTEFFVTIDQGTTSLRYSSACATAWARFQCASGGSGCTNYDIIVQRNNDGLTYTNSVRYPTFTPTNAVLYTLQLDDGVGQSAKACYRAAFDNWLWHCTSSF